VCVSIVSSTHSGHTMSVHAYLNGLRLFTSYTVHRTQYTIHSTSFFSLYSLCSFRSLYMNPYLSPWQIASPSHLFWNSTQKGMPSH
jgi:hypothetical protein